MSTTVKPISLSDFYAMFRNLLGSTHDGQGMGRYSFLGHLLPRRKKTAISISFVFMVAGAAFAGEWQRNTFPSTKHVEAGFAPGAGWSHTEAVQDISVSPADPNFRAMIANEWTAVFTEDGLNYKPLRMPHIGTPGCDAQSVDFSPHDPNTMYLRVVHSDWTSMAAADSPAGLWRGTRSPGHEMTWEHLYQPPADGYEAQEANNAGTTRMLEDPTVGRENHIYFGTTSDGLKRSTDDGATWETVVQKLANHRIKTVMAVAAADNETILYTIAEKKMPRKEAGQRAPVDYWQPPSNYDARWLFNENLNDESGNGKHLSGSVAAWTNSTMEGTHAATFNGSSPLTSTNLTYAGTHQRLAVSAWVQTTDGGGQSIISFDRNEYWELGIGSTLSTSGFDIGFTSAESYASGDLTANPAWSGPSGNLTVNPSGSGSVLRAPNSQWATYQNQSPLPSAERYTVGMDFSFRRTAGDITDSNNTVFEGLLGGSEAVGLALSREHGTGKGHLFKFKSNAGITSINRFASSGTFDEGLLGFSPTDDTSDTLRLVATFTRAPTPGQWTATLTLRNLTRGTEVMSWSRSEFTLPEEVFYASIALDEDDATLGVSDRVIDRFDATAVQAPGLLRWTVRDSGGNVNELMGPRIDDGDWHHVVGSFDRGVMRLFIDGEEVAFRNAGTNQLGSGNPVSGVIGAGFTGALDDVRIYNSNALNLIGAQQLYLEEDHKNPLVQGQLWRIRVNAAGDITEAVRLHAPLADFHEVEVNPQDPSQGWVIRKPIPNGHPYGGRELYKFSDFGETLTASTATLGASKTFDVVMVNPGNPNHVFLACALSKGSGLRWSMDGGTTWNGLNRKVGNFFPSINGWLPMDHKTFETGIEAAGQFIYRGSPFSFVPGEPGKLLWINQTMGGLLQSDDYGATWRTYATGGPNKDLGQIAVAQSNPDHWTIGLYEHGWSVTTNNGLSWTAETHHNNALLESLGDQAEADPKVGFTGARIGQGVAFHPINPDIMVATWSGNCYILRSTDAGRSWSDTGYRNPQQLGVDVFWSRTDANRVYAGKMRSDDAGVTWVEKAKVVIAVCDSNSDLLVGVDGMRKDVTEDLNLYVSSNGGNSWTILPDPPRETVPGTANQWTVTTTARKWGTMADALVAIDPGSSSSNLRILLAGRSGIYEYNGGSGSNAWTLRKTGLKNNRHLGPAEQVPWMGFVAFDPRPGYSHIVYAASQNDHATQGAWAGEENPNRTYPGGENTNPYYRSTDGGITWEHLHGANYPDAPGGGMIESMTVDSRGRMFSATTEGIYIFSNRAPAFTSGLVANFTNRTYPNGKLENNIGWGGGGADWVVTEPLGLVVNDTVGDKKSQHTTALNTTQMTVGAVLRFSESGAAPSTDWRTLLEIGLTGSEDLGVKLVRRAGTASEYQLVFTRGSDLGGAFNSGRVSGSRLGLNLAGGDADSDRLYLTYTITRGAQAGDTWTARTRLYNLDTDPGMSNAIISQNNLAANPADVLWGQGLYPYMNSGHNNASGNLTGLRIESFTATPEPALSSAPIVRADAIEGSAYLESLVGSATDPDPADRLSYAKIIGPDWLNVAPNGTLSGTPTNVAAGLHSFTVEVSDGRGGTDSATLEINVAGEPLGPYALWASDHEVGAMDEDDDKDGLDNLTEYALGGTPTNASDVGLLPTQLKTDDGWHYVYRRRLDPAAAGLVYTVETATNLASGDWTDTGTVEIDTDVIDSEFESVINAVDTTDKPALFIRLKIEAE